MDKLTLESLGRRLSTALLLLPMLGCGSRITPVLDDRPIHKLAENAEHILFAELKAPSACGQISSGIDAYCESYLLVKHILKGNLSTGAVDIRHTLLSDRLKWPLRQEAFGIGNYIVLANGSRDSLRLSSDCRRSTIPIAGNPELPTSGSYEEVIMSLVLNHKENANPKNAAFNALTALEIGPAFVGARKTLTYFKQAITANQHSSGGVELCAALARSHFLMGECLSNAIDQVRNQVLKCGSCNLSSLSALQIELEKSRKRELAFIALDHHEWFRIKLLTDEEDVVRTKYFYLTGRAWPRPPTDSRLVQKKWDEAFSLK